MLGRILKMLCCCCFAVLLTGSCYVPQAVLELTILLRMVSNSWQSFYFSLTSAGISGVYSLLN